MKCKFCTSDMNFIYCTDNPDKGYAYNVYACISCDTLLKEDVWDKAGKIWISTENNIVREKE